MLRYAGVFFSQTLDQRFSNCVSLLTPNVQNFSPSPLKYQKHILIHCHQTCSGLCIPNLPVNIPEAVKATPETISDSDLLLVGRFK